MNKLKEVVKDLNEFIMGPHHTVSELREEINSLEGQNEKLSNIIHEKDKEILALKTYINTLEIRLHPAYHESPEEVCFKYLKKYFNMHRNNNWFGCCDDYSKIPAIKYMWEFFIPGTRLPLTTMKILVDAIFDNNLMKFILEYENGIRKKTCPDYPKLAKIIKEKNLMEAHNER